MCANALACAGWDLAMQPCTSTTYMHRCLIFWGGLLQYVVTAEPFVCSDVSHAAPLEAGPAMTMFDDMLLGRGMYGFALAPQEK